MGLAISEEGKLREKRGTGSGKNYKPWTKIRELNSRGTASSFPDWKHGRMIQLLSQAELWAYIKLRWNDEVVDIREQYPLDLETTNTIARHYGFRPTANGRKRITTDFLVSYDTGNLHAFSVKVDRKSLMTNIREKQKQIIEYEYWKKNGIPWMILYKEDFNPIEIANIKDIVPYYDLGTVRDEFSLLRHLIARKIVLVDLKQPIDYPKILNEIKKDEIWKKYDYLSV